MNFIQTIANMFHAKHISVSKNVVSHETRRIDRAEVGKMGENTASNFLIHRNYRIIHRNFHMGKIGEIDIIAEKRIGFIPFFRRKVIVFVEVKSSIIGFFNEYLPEDRVNLRKFKKIKKLAEIYLIRNGIKLDTPWQIDAIAIEIDKISMKVSKIRHHENVLLE